jgi:hypothetical protein
VALISRRLWLYLILIFCLDEKDGILPMQKIQKLRQYSSGNTYDYDLASNRRTKAGRKRRQHSDKKGSTRTVMDYERYDMHSVWPITLILVLQNFCAVYLCIMSN